MKYITIKRLEYAQQKIHDGVYINEAAYMAGFGDYTAFYRSYKSYYGCPPSDKQANHSESKTHMVSTINKLSPPHF